MEIRILFNIKDKYFLVMRIQTMNLRKDLKMNMMRHNLILHHNSHHNKNRNTYYSLAQDSNKKIYHIRNHQ
jgi:hypothetical protein